ncbi:(2E,6E)-farnesyl diphosphate synthase [Oceanospirillum sanctuarii]|uniref:(2E,6E)-farnesyl diphosphate synthase n=1 Tax=Oceanospirillum sanctuarii TaxID=1434821 RepID=UPI002481986E|nr:farnesyl diphosphate synthase [Oceanospirillum sanctuarii]
MSIQEHIKPLMERSDHQLDQLLSASTSASGQLLDAMRYSVFNGGKRFRPVLAYAACQAITGQIEDADASAAAVELIHAYSLVHDDLPAMDDDDLRRGQPTCHIKFDEATAILAGDALQTAAFTALLKHNNPGHLPKLLSELTQASGALGMVAGQMIDLASVGHTLDVAALENMHRHKTGALICASVRMGAIAGNASETQLSALTTYAQALGLAFQVQDDILDVEGDTSTLGKQAGADAALDKPTYPALLGLEQAKAKAHELVDTALSALEGFGPEAHLLRELARYVIQRNH